MLCLLCECFKNQDNNTLAKYLVRGKYQGQRRYVSQNKNDCLLKKKKIFLK